MRLHAPIVKTTTAALASFFVVALTPLTSPSEFALTYRLLGWIFLGALYAQLVEYWYHKVPMHRGLPFLENIKRNHLEHHRIFYGANFRTRRPEDLSHIVGRWWIFPLLFFAHYALLVPVMAPDVLTAFLLGAVLHYVVFELTHWLTHVEGNALDRLVASIPLLDRIRAYQIEHHRIHHEVPEVAFNFNPPYLGDQIFGRMPRHAESLGVALPRPEPVAAEPAPPATPLLPSPVIAKASGRIFAARPLLRYGSAVVAGVAVIGLAALAAHNWWSHSKPPSSPEISI